MHTPRHNNCGDYNTVTKKSEATESMKNVIYQLSQYAQPWMVLSLLVAQGPHESLQRFKLFSVDISHYMYCQ